MAWAFATCLRFHGCSLTSNLPKGSVGYLPTAVSNPIQSVYIRKRTLAFYGFRFVRHTIYSLPSLWYHGRKFPVALHWRQA